MVTVCPIVGPGSSGAPCAREDGFDRLRLDARVRVRIDALGAHGLHLAQAIGVMRDRSWR